MDCGKGIFRRQTRKTHRSVTKRRSILALILRHSLESIAKLETYQHHIFMFRLVSLLAFHRRLLTLPPMKL